MVEIAYEKCGRRARLHKASWSKPTAPTLPFPICALPSRDATGQLACRIPAAPIIQLSRRSPQREIG